jgi:hypothetical protein
MLERIRHKIKKILLLDYSPRRIAMSCAIGVFIGFSPYVGLHTGLAMGASFLFGLPLYPLIVGAYITNPFTLVPVYTLCYKFGVLITGKKASTMPDFSHFEYTAMMHTAKTFFIPFFVGTHLLGLILAVITYILSYYLVKKYKGRVV